MAQRKSMKHWDRARAVRLNTLRAGDKVIVDGDFTCMKKGKIVEVYADPKDGKLYVPCRSGGHELYSQADDGDHLVGMWPA